VDGACCVREGDTQQGSSGFVRNLNERVLVELRDRINQLSGDDQSLGMGGIQVRQFHAFGISFKVQPFRMWK
jgi:hypothetical protein